MMYPGRVVVRQRCGPLGNWGRSASEADPLLPA